MKYLIIDVHVHTYPTRELGLRAKEGIELTEYDGTVEDLLRCMKANKIAKAVMVNILPVVPMRDAALAKLPGGLSSEQLEDAMREIDKSMVGRLQRRNLWTCSVAKENQNLVPYISLDPILGSELMKQEILDEAGQGAKGIKLIGDYGQYYVNDKRMWPAYEAAQQLGLPILFHSGKSGNPPHYSEPRLFKDIASNFPRLTMVLAHLGMVFFDQAISLAKTYDKINFDCSNVITDERVLSDPDLVSLIKEMGAERIMFGSDWPTFDPALGIQRLLRLNLTEKEKQLVLGENAKRILNLS